MRYQGREYTDIHKLRQAIGDACQRCEFCCSFIPVPTCYVKPVYQGKDYPGYCTEYGEYCEASTGSPDECNLFEPDDDEWQNEINSTLRRLDVAAESEADL